MTRYAQQILDMINESTDHMTAEQIFLRMKEESPKIVLATVYNNLNSLYDQDLIRKVSVEGSPDRYDKIRRHDHLVCRQCGRLTDIELPDLIKDLQAKAKVELLSYDLKLSYICPECQKREDERLRRNEQ